MLLGLAVIPLLAAAIGIPVADWLRHVRELDPEHRDTIQTVPPGGVAELYDVRWLVTFNPLKDPDADPPPGTKTLRIDVEMMPLTPDGAKRDTDPEFEIRHPDGRKWLVAVADRPMEPDREAGQTYSYVLGGRVPADADGRLALAVRPSDLIPYDGPIGDDFMQKMAEDAEKARTDRVLLFPQR